MNLIITIDGPAGTGKTTVAKKTAERLGLPYFDTGAMYRAVAFLILHEKIPLSDEKRISELLANFDFEIRDQGAERKYVANGRDVTDVIRSQAVTNIVSPVSALHSVRQALWAIQRNFARKRGGVFEGRDMGSVVFPEATIKVFLTARPDVRAERRLAELHEKRPEEARQMSHQQMLEEIMKRDQIDSSRALAPLLCPPDAYVIDTSNISIDEVVERIIEYREKKNLKPAWMQSRSITFLYRCVILFTWLIGKIFYRLKVYGLQHYYPRGAILASNHTSFLDPPIISVCWPEEVHFLARQTLFKNPLFGALIRNLNTHPVSGEPGDIRVMKTIVSLLEQGKKVVLFPEGTRSQDGELHPFKPGISMLIARSKSAIIPVYIDGAYRAWNRHQKIPHLFVKVSCIFGTPITWESFLHLDKKEAQKQITEKLQAAILGLKKWFEEGAHGIPP
ncbi:MAG TPA: (d)CMP kinase [Rhabdochlamydiaceae bacterium]|jgi:cytidylate kinase|nr:(d)CMP kinase [Rhabdochlamydiaceae bacterium]